MREMMKLAEMKKQGEKGDEEVVKGASLGQV